MKGSLVVATWALLSVPGVTGLAQDDTAKMIERLEDELNAAFHRFDASALDRLWDEDLAFVSPNGTLANKAERLAGLESPPPNIPTSANESVAVKVYGDAAVAIVLSKWSGTTDGKPFVTRFRATHVWARRSGQWKLVAAHVSQMKD